MLILWYSVERVFFSILVIITRVRQIDIDMYNYLKDSKASSLVETPVILLEVHMSSRNQFFFGITSDIWQQCTEFIIFLLLAIKIMLSVDYLIDICLTVKILKWYNKI